MDDRPSAWLAGAGLGLCLGSGALLAAYASHVALGWSAVGLFVGLFTFGLGLMPFAEFLARGLWAAVSTVAEAWNSWGAPTMPGNQEIQPQISTQDEFDAERHAWNVALGRFFSAGERAGGFSVRRLEGVVGEPTWTALVHFYETTAGGNVLRDWGGDRGYGWGYGWSYDKLTLALHAGRLPLPPGDVPVVEIYVSDTTRRDSTRQRKTRATPAAQAIIDN